MHQLGPALDVQSRQEVAQTAPPGWKQSHRKADTETVTCHRPPAMPPCPPDAPHRARPGWRDPVGETGTRPEPLGPAPRCRHQSSRNRLSRLVPGTGTAPPSRGAANEKPACPPPRGALAADLFTLPEVERPLSASCALLEPYYNIFASES